jgi:hypothetical protein
MRFSLTAMPLRLASSLRRLLAMLILAFPATAAVQARAPGAEPPDRNAAAALFVWVQLIHTVQESGPVDLYIDGERVEDDLAFGTATPFMPFPIGLHTLELVAGADADNARPLWAQEQRFAQHHHYALLALGSRDTLAVLVHDAVRREAASADAEFFFIHDVPDAPLLDIRLLDPRVPNQLEDILVNNFTFGDVTTYRRLEPRAHDFQLMNADNTAEFKRFRFNLSAYGGKALFFVLTGRFADGSVRLIGYDADGGTLSEVPVGTADEAASPETFTLLGAYPNPFHRATTIAFTLPEPAHVYVEVIDLLGRTVLTTPAQRVEAGGNHTLSMTAAGLASGPYLYRVVAQTATGTLVRTGQMMRVR